MACPVCRSENPVGAKFCFNCGTRLAVACPSCGAPTLPDARFCNECGTSLGGAPAPDILPAVGQAEPVAERRHVTVLFADLVGFTPFAEERDAEDVREVLTRYFDLARGIVESYGGTVEKFIGDAVMAVWGAPIAREDDAGRAVRSALDLVEAVRTLGPTIQARAGVLTGEAAVTFGATNQGMVAGDIVNTAARLQSVAASRDGPRRRGDIPGGIRLDRVRTGRRADAQGQDQPRPSLAGPPGHRGARRTSVR